MDSLVHGSSCTHYFSRVLYSHLLRRTLSLAVQKARGLFINGSTSCSFTSIFLGGTGAGLNLNQSSFNCVWIYTCWPFHHCASHDQAGNVYQEEFVISISDNNSWSRPINLTWTQPSNSGFSLNLYSSMVQTSISDPINNQDGFELCLYLLTNPPNQIRLNTTNCSKANRPTQSNLLIKVSSWA